MNVWVAFPSVEKHRAEFARDQWGFQGYEVALFLNPYTSVQCGYSMSGTYPGYWAACNQLLDVLFMDRDADVVVLAADDMAPDLSYTADEIARSYFERFPDGYGVMQPCGDKQGVDKHGSWNSKRICGSPWIGRGWWERAYGGKMATPDFYKQFWGDEELYEVAKREGVLWMREDLKQDHRHWSFGRQQKTDYQKFNERYCRRDHETFKKRKEEGFPESEPLPREMDTETD